MTEATRNSPVPEVTFARTLGLFDATMIGVGAMIGAGVFVLIGAAAWSAGPLAVVAFAANGAVTLLTAFAYAELCSAMPESGGGYAFVRRAFPGAAGFFTGWMLWLANTVACSLYASGFAAYAADTLAGSAPGLVEFLGRFGIGLGGIRALLVLGIVGLFVWINILGTGASGKAENLVTVAKLGVLAVFILFGLASMLRKPELVRFNYTALPEHPWLGVVAAMGVIFIAFEGYELIANVAEEIRDPERTIPKAIFLSIGIAVSVYILIAIVAIGAVEGRGPDGERIPSWEHMGRDVEARETAMREAAEAFMPAGLVWSIVLGAIVSTLSALNATILGSSRLAFSMGRDRWLPAGLSAIHPRRRTPHVAIAATAVVLLPLALLMRIEEVGSAASVLFLIAFAMVNLALISLRRKYPEARRRFRVPFYPVTPIVAALISLALAGTQLAEHPTGWRVIGGWLAVGVGVYFLYGRTAAGAVMPQVADFPTGLEPSEGEGIPYRVLVPVSNPATAPRLLELGLALAAPRGGGVTALIVVEVPRQLPIGEGARYVAQKQPLLRAVRTFGAERGVEIAAVVKIAHGTGDGILASARSEKADLILMGWKGYTSTDQRFFGEVVDKVIRLSPCDLALVRFGTWPVRSVLLPTSGGPHARRAARMATDLRESLDVPVVGCNVVRPGAAESVRAAAHERIVRTFEGEGKAPPDRAEVLDGEDVSAAVAGAADAASLVVIGAAKEPFFRRVLVGGIAERLAREGRSTVMVVKRYEGPIKGWIKRAFG